MDFRAKKKPLLGEEKKKSTATAPSLNMAAIASTKIALMAQRQEGRRTYSRHVQQKQDERSAAYAMKLINLRGWNPQGDGDLGGTFPSAPPVPNRLEFTKKRFGKVKARTDHGQYKSWKLDRRAAQESLKIDAMHAAKRAWRDRWTSKQNQSREPPPFDPQRFSKNYDLKMRKQRKQREERQKDGKRRTEDLVFKHSRAISDSNDVSRRGDIVQVRDEDYRIPPPPPREKREGKWIAARDEYNHVYWYNTLTRESTWIRPRSAEGSKT